MANKTAWANDEYMVKIKTTAISCNLQNNDNLTKVIVSDPTGEFYYRDVNTIGGGPQGPTGATGTIGPTGPQGQQGQAGAGNMTGPNGTLNRAVPSFNGTSGQQLQSSLIQIDTIGSGLIFPNATTTSALSLDYYEYYETIYDFYSSVTGLVVLPNVTIKFIRIGKIIFIEIPPNMSTNPTSSIGVLFTLSTIPSRFMPQGTTTLYCQVRSQGVNVMGSITINSNGTLESHPMASSTVVTLGGYVSNGLQFGFYQYAHVSYMI